MGRKAIRELARGMLIAERMRLAGIERALRTVREGATPAPAVRREQTRRPRGGRLLGAKGRMVWRGTKEAARGKVKQMETA